MPFVCNDKRLNNYFLLVVPDSHSAESFLPSKESRLGGGNRETGEY